MNTITQEVIFGVVFFLLITTVIFIIARYTYLIRKAMAENGLQTPKAITKGRLLHFGGILIGLGIGLMVSSIFTMLDLTETTADLLIWGTIVLFGGLGLIVANFLGDKFGN
ncbi:DUF6249 domain-containing protein [Marinirhabdus gelatinilytica]|uniref:DUF6249 domain-containing protein n=1 Tax=Marinirhabdus gelatinilytica TaxID=1703343 RepID=A0A370QIY4_9FLAO|nr:DUF6249 domain-containing protein [Marinirhabdus gelatinilytica]RDK88327.1 hypothetical protein C8D94_101197 [Marinirhabdus gelatinilytica]